MEIYVKAKKKVSIFNRNEIKIGDIAEVFAPKQIMEGIKKLQITHIDAEKPQRILLSIIDIIELIDKEYPNNTINSVGENDILVHFEKKEKVQNKLWQWIKIIAVCLILLGGSATAIMSFHTDAQIPTVFRNFYYVFFDETTENMALIDIPYSIGLAVGIIVFFSHFSKGKEISDPTPIDVEMSTYEEDITKTMIDKMSASETTIGRKSKR